MTTTTKNKVQTINETTIAMLQGLELTAIECLSEGMDGTNVYNHLSTMYGDVLGHEVIRMVVNSADLLYNE